MDLLQAFDNVVTQMYSVCEIFADTREAREMCIDMRIEAVKEAQENWRNAADGRGQAVDFGQERMGRHFEMWTDQLKKANGGDERAKHLCCVLSATFDRCIANYRSSKSDGYQETEQALWDGDIEDDEHDGAIAFMCGYDEQQVQCAQRYEQLGANFQRLSEMVMRPAED